MAELTPMMQQYLQIKKEYSDHIIFFRLGDFYEMFFDDAKIASRELDLTLTGRSCGQEERAPMCGVPYHSSQSYIARLVSKGYKVAICEQVEDPALATGLVKRDIVRIVTPGTVTDSNMLDETQNNYIAAFCAGESIGLCFSDISTGEIYATSIGGDTPLNQAINEIGKYSPKEILLPKSYAQAPDLVAFLKRINCMVTVTDGVPDEQACGLFLANHFGKNTEQLGVNELPEVAAAVCILLSYAKETQKTDISYISRLNIYSDQNFMTLPLTTVRNLEITHSLRNHDKKGTLLHTLDRTKTAMGGRLIRKWLEQPLINCIAIQKRHSAVKALVDSTVERIRLCEQLSQMHDLERLLTKLIGGTANGRDLKSISQTLVLLPALKTQLGEFSSSALLNELHLNLDTLEDIASLIESSIADEPPFSIREGGIIKDGYNSDVDELRSVLNDGKGWIAKAEADEREKTGIKNLKISYNRVFGYYIEVTKSMLSLVPETYIRKQTLANCERYITDELKQYEGKVLGASDRLCTLEFELFNDIRRRIVDNTDRIQRIASVIAQLDVLCSFAAVSSDRNYVMPQMDYSDVIDIKDGRHPVVEEHLSNTFFVPNDTYLDCNDNRTAVITGPNMAGKSTYMRQVAVIVLMAQAGCFVPAKSAHLGVVDSIFTRVGASDDLASGQSTFMVEMSEVAEMVTAASKKSLLIFDEIGRGTSTFDGMSIARAVVEYVTNKNKLGAKTLFATHYHELTELEDVMDGVKNYNIAVKKRGDDITFLRKIVRGGTDDSYGIEVAKLAGVPKEITDRAKAILKILEQQKISGIEVKKSLQKTVEDDTDQISLGDMREQQVADKLRKLDLNTITPIEAMSVIYELQKLLAD